MPIGISKTFLILARCDISGVGDLAIHLVAQGPTVREAVLSFVTAGVRSAALHCRISSKCLSWFLCSCNGSDANESMQWITEDRPYRTTGAHKSFAGNAGIFYGLS